LRARSPIPFQGGKVKGKERRKAQRHLVAVNRGDYFSNCMITAHNNNRDEAPSRTPAAIVVYYVTIFFLVAAGRSQHAFPSVSQCTFCSEAGCCDFLQIKGVETYARYALFFSEATSAVPWSLRILPLFSCCPAMRVRVCNARKLFSTYLLLIAKIIIKILN